MQFCTFDYNALDLTAFFESSAWGEAGSSDGTTGSASGGQDVFSGGVDFGGGELAHVQVSGVLGVGSVAVVAGRDDRVEKVLQSIFNRQI